MFVCLLIEANDTIMNLLGLQPPHLAGDSENQYGGRPVDLGVSGVCGWCHLPSEKYGGRVLFALWEFLDTLGTH